AMHRNDSGRGGSRGGGRHSGPKGNGRGSADTHVRHGAASGRAEALVITGCGDPVVGPIIRGSYTLASENHDRPVYRKDEKVGAKGLD
ncbi:unnamed protein product, partial [Polarella glacialis]